MTDGLQCGIIVAVKNSIGIVYCSRCSANKNADISKIKGGYYGH